VTVFRALVVIALLLTACGDHVASSGLGQSPTPAIPTKATSDPTPSATSTPTTVAFPDKLSFVVGTNDGLLYSQLVNGAPAGSPLRACDGLIGTLASYGRKVLVVCPDATPKLAIFDADARTISVIPGVEPLEATWTNLGDSVVYTAIGACEPPAPICKTKLMQRDLRTGATTQLDEQYGVGRDLRLTGEGVTVWRGMNMDSFVRQADQVGTWVVRGTTVSRFSQQRLVDGGKGRDLFETEETSFNAGCCTAVMTGYQMQAQRLTPSSVSNERAIALLEDGRIVAFRPDSKNNMFVGSVVVYRAGVVERSDRGNFSPYRVVRDLDWIVGFEYAPGGTLRAYRISDGAFASASGGNITALAPLGPAKPPIP
jgi:hypothetical protein